MDWRLAGSLVKLREQINAAYPNRSKVSDGTIGDVAHQADKTSDHNPNAAGVVTAFDITHDPANGLDIDKLSDALADSRDPRIKYLIANGEILVPADFGWVWQPYSGIDPHTSHLHISVYGDYDNQAEWNIGENKTMTEQDVRLIIKAIEHRDANAADIKAWTGLPASRYAEEAMRGSKWLTQNHYITFFTTLDKQVKDQASQIENLKKTTPIGEEKLRLLYDTLGKFLGK